MTPDSIPCCKRTKPTAIGVLWVVLGALTLCLPQSVAAPRVLPDGQVPDDVRLQPVNDLDGYFPFAPPETTGAWNQRAERVRQQILVTLGLWPMPTKAALNPAIYGKVDRGDYTVEKVHFESLPGFYVTGSLYRPKGKSGKVPGVLCPHGHWANGRFLDSGIDAVRKEIVDGAERFEEGGRSVLQARCVQLARMGCVVFHYDMIGYADSVQIPSEVAHGFAKQRPEMNTLENWGLFSPQAEAHFQSVMGLQTWNSIRSLDFLLGLPDVDAERIACTGASGGGTQTFILGAIDPRVKVAFPAVMVSTAMQGGCTCENACGLRIGTGNVEFAALFAPKPLGLTSADDWTKAMATRGFPELKQLYTLVGAPANVMLKRGEHFEHNYNYVSRAAMYAWLNKHFNLGFKEPVVEGDYHRLTREELSVWDAEYPKPSSGPEVERRVLRWLTDDAQAQLNRAAESADGLSRLSGSALEVILGRRLEHVGPFSWEVTRSRDPGDHQEVVGLLKVRAHKEELPVILLQPKKRVGRTVLWLTEQGKAGLFAGALPDAQLRPGVLRLLQAGYQVASVDLLFQGEFVTDGQAVKENRRVKNPREAAAYTFGYNRPLFAQRVHDVLSVAKFLTTGEHQEARLALLAVDGTGPLAAAARALAGKAVEQAAINTQGFRFLKVPSIYDVNFLPGGAKYGDLLGMLALGAPGRLWLAGEGDQVHGLVARAYQRTSAAGQVTAYAGDVAQSEEAAIAWLLTAAPR